MAVLGFATRTTTPHSQIIPLVHWVVADEPVQVYPAVFTDGVAGDEASGLGRVVAVAVVIQPRFAVEVLGGETEAEGVGEEAGLGDGVTVAAVSRDTAPRSCWRKPQNRGRASGILALCALLLSVEVVKAVDSC